MIEFERREMSFSIWSNLEFDSIWLIVDDAISMINNQKIFVENEVKYIVQKKRVIQSIIC
jgi:hypothetical protein